MYSLPIMILLYLAASFSYTEGVLDEISKYSHGNEQAHKTRVKVESKEVSFVTDTRAEVSAITKNIFEAIGSPQLYKLEQVCAVQVDKHL